MNKKFVKLLSATLLSTMVLSLNAFSAFASYGSGSVQVPKEQKMVLAESGITRTKNYSYVVVQVNSVYPVGTYTQDNFSKCIARLYSNTESGKAISDKYVIQEGSSVRVILNDGYMNESKVNLHFSGNSPKYSAWVTYTYKGK